MSREYVLPLKKLTMTSSSPNTYLFINNGSGSGFPTLEVLRMYLSQSGTTTSAQQDVQVYTQVTTFPTLTSVSLSPLSSLDPASKIVGSTTGAAGTAGVNASGEGTGAKTVIWADNFNNLNGWLWVATPAETYKLANGQANGFGVGVVTTPSSVASWSGGIVYRELG